MHESILNALSNFDSALPSAAYQINWPASYTHPIPLEVEASLSDALTAVQTFDETTWRAIRAKVSSQLDDKLLAYALRSATLATRTRNATHLDRAMSAAILGNDYVYDYRDLFIVTSAIYDAATRLNVDAASVVRSAAHLATPGRAHTLTSGYLARPREMMTLDRFGLVAIETSNGFEYRFF
jgi:hypothetical protein